MNIRYNINGDYVSNCMGYPTAAQADIENRSSKHKECYQEVSHDTGK